MDVPAGQVGEGPSDEELQKAKDYLIGSYALGFDTSTKIAHTLAQIAFEGLGLDYIARRSHRRPLRGQDARSWSPLIHSKAGGPELTHLP